MTTTKTLFALSAFAAALAGCSSTPIATPTPPAAQTVAAPATTTVTAAAPGAATARATASSSVATVEIPAYLDPKSDIASRRSIYFDFDSTTLTGDDTQLIDRHSRFLTAAPQVKIRVEGNGDERGSAEYNLSLGQRRAETVANALKIAGVRDSQLDVVSWGEEKPRNPGHDEQAWAQNRRADLVYPSK